jgi:hypothetical protein
MPSTGWCDHSGKDHLKELFKDYAEKFELVIVEDIAKVRLLVIASFLIVTWH